MRRRRGDAVRVAAVTLCLAFGTANADDLEKPEFQAEPDATTPRAVELESRLAPLREAVRAAPADADAHRALGRALVDARRFDDGIEHLARSLALRPETGRKFDLAVAYGKAARIDEAVALYEEILVEAPGMPVVLHNLGRLAMRRNDTDAAIGFFTQALETRPNYLFARLQLGDAFRAAGRKREAYRAFEQVLGMEPTTPAEAGGYLAALYGVAALDLEMGAHERAGRFLEQLIQLDPEHDKAYYAYGQVLMHLGKTDEAEKAFAKHVEILSKKQPTSAAAMGE